jgi:DNA-directed RNA polymerase subunit RPC12/RpoP
MTHTCRTCGREYTLVPSAAWTSVYTCLRNRCPMCVMNRLHEIEVMK